MRLALLLASSVAVAAAPACSASLDGLSGGGANGGADGATDGGGATGAGPAIGAPEQGRATYYGADGTGACSFDPSPDDLDVAAMDAPEWSGSAPCGACARVEGPKGAVTVRIVDLCPGCERGHLDLSEQAFAAIAAPSAGNVPVTWTLVACDVQGNVAYHYKDGSSQWWTAVQVRNHRLPIAKLEIEKSGAWAEIPRANYNYFVDAKGAGTGQVHVRITAVDGQTLEDTLPPPASDVTVQGSGQFR